MMSFAHDEMFKSFLSSSSLTVVRDMSFVSDKGLAADCLNWALVLISYNTESHSWPNSCIFSSSKSIRATS